MGMGIAANPTPTATSGVIYPHRFSNNERITFHNCPAAQTLVEYPLRLPTEVGAARHRVVYDYNKPHQFCGCMTHDGAIGNQFVACNWQHWLSDPLVEQDGLIAHPPQISEMDIIHDANE
ncbi:hypothetical protein SERLADRAFT_435608 [Serpula lacrymans var. lacrymans S7.9]|uniref:Uncharacterized protein n=1 Tax=Serpula lacrymans var. lacrymans (strain S7.9) TaxID=578457 RepID=F8NM51_SERL9|nr:uncharacterized protein SERLADRAFT_435608 [Serpula lacrymans var. lacrymans S7.9]EGO27839.1 hypothetical protein SERLADRAFT_435608 [Serpula lacrymans var. lacrymans S7.9]